MSSEWLAVEAGTDLLARARQVQRSWESLLAGGALDPELPPGATAGLRPTIVESWRRSLATGLDPTDLLPSVEADPFETRERWLEHPLGLLTHVLVEQLQTLAEESNSLVQVTDASGLTLHLHGPEWLKARAAEMNLIEGARCSETVNGTNGVGTALAANHPVQVFASEHFSHHHREWVCSGAPIHDPAGGIVGILDLSSPWKIAHPRSLELVTIAARAMEQCLRETRRDQDARLRRRYGDFTMKSTDLLVDREGYVLVGDNSAHPEQLDVPETGGEIALHDGSVAVAEPLGQGEAFLIRRVASPRASAARAEAPERAAQPARKNVREYAALRDAGDRGLAVKLEGGPTPMSEQRISAYFKATLDSVIIADASGTVVEFNPAAERTFGYSRDEALGRTIAELIVPPSLRERHITAFGRLVQTGHGSMLGHRLELTAMRADGSEFPVELALSRVETEPILICGALRDLSGAKQAEKHLRELAEEQAALRRVAILVARESLPQELFAVVAEQVARIFSVPLVRLVRYEADGSAAVLVGGWGESVDPLAIGTRWELDGPGVLASVWQTGRSARLDDYTDVSGEPAAVVRQAGMRSAVASPIVVEGHLWGAIAVLSPHLEPLPDDTEARLSDFTELVATAIANAESRAELAGSERRARELATEQAALRRVATLVAREPPPDKVFAVVAEEVGRVLSVPAVALLRYLGDGSAVELVNFWSDDPLPLQVGMRVLLNGPDHITAVWKTQHPARLDDVDVAGEIAATMRQVGFRSGAASPILVEGRLWGVVGIGSSERLPEGIESPLADFTELVATAIANSEARDHLRRLLGEQAALRRVATLVAQGTNADELFAAVSEEVRGLFGAEVAIARFDPDEGAMVVVGLTEGIPVVSRGTRWPLEEFLASTKVYRTGRPARSDHTGHLAASNMVADSLRTMAFVSTVAAPIVVEGNLWGVVTVNDKHTLLPPDTEARVEKFAELVGTAVANVESRAELATSETRARRLATEQAALRRVATLVAKGARSDELFSAVAQEVAGVIGVPVVGVQRYEGDGTFTMMGIAGETSFTVGSRWPIEEEALAGMILASGRPARKDDYSLMPGALGAALRDDRMMSTVGVPIMVDANIWGFMVAGGRPGEQIPVDAEEHLARFTELVATAVSNATIRADLVASRARVVATADETRRRIERDLHDGAQQQLVSLSLALRSAQARVPVELEDLRSEVGRFAERLARVTEELREMSRGIHPAVLSEGGLSPALEALAVRSAAPVKLNVRCERRLPDTVEVAAYYVASEALTNAAKHANASGVEIDLDVGDGILCLSIRDDGVGGADPSHGSGLIGLRDRVEALGGTIEVGSTPGAGTRLDVKIPLLAAA